MTSQIRILASLAGAVLLLLATAVPTTAQEEARDSQLSFLRAHDGYLTTLSWGTGLIDTPVAWTSPASGGLSFHTAVHGAGSLAHVQSLDNIQLGGHLSLFKHAEGGFVVHDGNSGALFGRVVLHRDDSPGWLPGLAVGMRNLNLGQVEQRDRFGYHCTSTTIHSAVQDCKLENTLTFYGVASNRFWVGPLSASWSLGWGNGLFREVPTFAFDPESAPSDPQALYNSDAEPNGAFGGLRISSPMPAPFTALHVVGEWNGWDLNTGVALEGMGIELGAYITEAEHLGSSSEKRGPMLYNYPKFSVNVTANTNILSRGELDDNQRVRRLTAEVTALEAKLRERTEQVNRLEAILAEGGMPEDVITELRAFRDSLEERIAGQEREIRRLEAELEALRGRTDRSGGGSS